ncbi:MAG: V-type ATP synthase subunit D [Chlamydiota bacterium]
MSRVRLTKNSLREQEKQLQQLEKYLPTLQLKKNLLQTEVCAAKGEILTKKELFIAVKKTLEQFAPLFLEEIDYDFSQLLEVQHVNKYYENIAGVEIPVFESVRFQEELFFLFDTPPWLNSALDQAKQAVTIKEHIAVLEEKKRSLEKELREVSLRVNLFEKVLIPRAKGHIKKIHVFLGDQELAAVAQAKIAKEKIEKKKKTA